MRTIILGCGITGLITCHLIKDSIAIEAADKPYKDFSDESFPKFLEVCPQIDSLYKSIQLKPEIAPFDIDVLWNGAFVSFFEQSFRLKESIYKDYCLKKYGIVRPGKMNEYMETTCKRWYYTNKNQLLSALYELNKDRIVLNSRVNEINLKGGYIMVSGNEVYDYNHLISTLPIPLFNNLSGVNIEHQKIDLKTVEVTLSEKFELADFVYVPDIKYCFHRITKSCDSKRLSFEFLCKSDHNGDHLQFIKLYIGRDILDERMRLFSFPVCESTPIVNDKVSFIGRFATGNYNTKVEDVIDDIERIKTTI